MARKASLGLVREFLEKVSGNLLEDQYRPGIASIIQGHAGIYVLYKGERLYYVGLATNLMARVNHHLRDRHAGRWDKFSVYLTNDNEHIKPLESLLLRIVDPKGNQVKGKLPGAVDQKRRLNQAMREADSNRRAILLGGHLVKRRVQQQAAAARGTLGLAGVMGRAVALRAQYKGETYRATLRKDGYIAYAGGKYPSPSAAGREVCKRSVNGWAFWHYRVPKTGWVPLARLRK